MDLGTLPAVELQFQVERLLARYAHCIDEDRLEEWPAFFTEDCLYRVISRENHDRGLPAAAIFCDSRRMLVDRVVSARNANIYERHHYRHVIGCVLVERGAGEVLATSNYAVYRTRTDGATALYNTGRYRDRIVLVDGEWKFRAKEAVFDTHRIDTLLVTPL